MSCQSTETRGGVNGRIRNKQLKLTLVNKCSICHILFLLNTYPPPSLSSLSFSFLKDPHQCSVSVWVLSLPQLRLLTYVLGDLTRKRGKGEGSWVLDNSKDVLHQLFYIRLLVKACRPQPQMPLLESGATRKETDSSYMEPHLNALLASWDSVVKYRQFQVQKYLWKGERATQSACFGEA